LALTQSRVVNSCATEPNKRDHQDRPVPEKGARLIGDSKVATSLSSALAHAASCLGQSAKAVNSNAASTGLTPLEYERLLGFGTSCDWVGWARYLLSISYSDKRRSASDRAYGLNELTRFTFMWTATNALFARSSIIELLEPASGSKTSELERFRVLFRNCSLPVADAATFEGTLHSLLALPMHVQYFPWAPANRPPTILEVIYFKHTVAHEQARGLGKKMLWAATNQDYRHLDLPTLIYATRNWNIHGVLLSSSFRGTRKKFNIWIDTINLALSRILEGSSVALQRAI
jgi:hypothetical protein